MPHPDYRHVYNVDYGKGFGAVDILANICYASLLIYGCFILWASSFNSAALIGLLYLPVQAVLVYVARLVIRAILAWRDKIAHDLAR
jgi:hypothetical protein